jgi:acyl-CoA dehydrogenase
MEVFARYGSEEQKTVVRALTRWKDSLLLCYDRARCCASDAANSALPALPALLDGDEWVLNGEKTYISGAGDARCKIMICMVKTDPGAGPYQQHSQILVPMDVEGLEILHLKMVLSLDDAPHGHMHLCFTNVRVPKENMILGRGPGFEISQGRLGPGRIHHCMRAIGMAERALKMLCKRAESRVAFGKALFRLGANDDIIADARMNIDMARLLTLKTAHVIDSAGVREAQTWISKIKVVVPNVTL